MTKLTRSKWRDEDEQGVEVDGQSNWTINFGIGFFASKMKLKVFRSTWGLVDASDGDKAEVSFVQLCYIMDHAAGKFL